MTLLKPNLFVRRLVIRSSEGGVAYDETFHRGVNIIRGVNSSGKSTIANFIFFSLGGEFMNWTAEAKNCREVFVETEMSEATLTLKRIVAEAPQQPMSIFWGDYENAKQSGFEGWKHFPYRQTQKESFSNVLFSALALPEVRSPEDNKLTMHQVLRLLYIDQESPTQNLFRFERFDPPLMRQTVAELLLGFHDDSLYNDRLALRNAEQRLHQNQQDLSAISKVFGSTGNEIDISKIRTEMARTRKELDKVQEEIEKIKTKAFAGRQARSPQIEKLQIELASLKANVSKITGELKECELDIVDSKEFIEALRTKLVGLGESIATRRALGELPLEYCPLCLSPLTDSPADGHCFLCKQGLPSDVDKTLGKRLEQEIQLQIKESEKLLEEKNRKLGELSGKVPPLIERLHVIQKTIDLEEKQYSSTRDQKLDELLISKGRLENQLEVLSRQIGAAERLEVLKKELQELAGSIESLKQQIKMKEEKEARNYRNALATIERLTLLILSRDLDYQPEFRNANTVEINFMKDTFSLDGNNNFSASSNIYLKNAIRFAIFFASLDLPYFRYPRSIICDNTEDKGMEPARSQNFQRVITELSQSYNVEHQIVLTTSMIDPTLDNPKYCVGEHYTKVNKSLKIRAN